MNYRGSYRALFHNSKSAMLAAIEIYNKPAFTYRDECFCILLINSWELLLKAILSKHQERIFYAKERNKPYRTLSLDDALRRGQYYFPHTIEYQPVCENIRILVKYRDNAIHFYNNSGFGVLIYSLAQTSIQNYRDLALATFALDIADEMTIALLPLGIGMHPDPIEFLQKSISDPPKNRAVSQFIQDISEASRSLEQLNFDTGRFLTAFKVHLQSVRKISSADIVVGLSAEGDVSNTSVVFRDRDPNRSHPMRQRDVLERIGGTLAGHRFTSHTFQAVVWKYRLKEKPHFFWASSVGMASQYSLEVLTFLRSLSSAEVQLALDEYRRRSRANP